MKTSDEDNNNRHRELAKKLTKVLDDYSVDIGLNTLIAVLITGVQGIDIKKDWFMTKMFDSWDYYKEETNERN